MIENIKEVSEHFDADVYTYIGPIYPPDDQLLVELIRDNKSRKNALLIFDTPGGSADATYRIARAFQRTYKTREPLPEDRGRLIIYVHEICKSAGTLLTLAADELILSQLGELGPIDVQLRKDDEVGERMSGLTPHQALETLQMESGQHFARFSHASFVNFGSIGNWDSRQGYRQILPPSLSLDSWVQFTVNLILRDWVRLRDLFASRQSMVIA